ncbi:MAG: peptidylprolyl isomerase [bacterium]
MQNVSLKHGMVMGIVTMAGVAVLSAAIGCTPKDKPGADAGKTKKTSAVLELPAADLKPMAPATVLVDVGGVTLTAGEADVQIERMLGGQANLNPEQKAQLMPRFRQQVADRFVVRTLLGQEADRRKIEVVDADVTKAIDEIQSTLPAGMTLETALAKDGLSMVDFRGNLVSELRMKKLVDAACPVADPDDAAVEAFYKADTNRFASPETVQARHILLKVEESATPAEKAARKADAEAIQKQLVEGKLDFAKTAMATSDCPSKARGGDLGSFARGQMVKPFEDAAFGQAPDVIGPVVETPFGFHIIQVVKHSPATITPLDEVRTKIRVYLKSQGQKDKFEVFLEGLRKKAVVKGPLASTPQSAASGEQP